MSEPMFVRRAMLLTAIETSWLAALRSRISVAPSRTIMPLCS